MLNSISGGKLKLRRAAIVETLKAPQSRQDRAGATQPHPDTIALYQRQIRDLEAELEAANGYIRSLESRCAMQARQLGYG